VFDYVGVREYLRELFAQRIDVIDREALKPHILAATARDAVYAF
jgi:predicted nucleotidyltransferase